jgi:anti-sigma regulatory factor (Ser/Thr protein kinase)
VTNAVLHSGCGGDHLLQVRARRRPDRLLISVHDPGLSGQSASLKESDFGLWGLHIIERLAQRWGCERPDGYRVWAELAVPT